MAKDHTSSSFRILLCFFFLLFSPILSVAQEPDKHGGTIVLSTVSDPKTFNDIIASETSSSIVTNLIFEGLTRTNAETLLVEPNLAERWTVSEDGREWTFYLRKDVLWNDGEPFTADDVVFTFTSLIFNPDIPSSSRDVLTINGEVFKLEKIDDHTVRFTLPVKFAPFLRGMSQSILPAHKLRKAVEEKKFNFTWGIDTPPGQIVGTGPFLLDEYRPGERLVFKRNPLYWRRGDSGRLPYLDRIIYLIVQSVDTEVLKFMDGELDACGVRGSDYPLIKPKEKAGNFTVYDTGPNFGTNFITFNQNSKTNPQTGQPFVDPVKGKWFTNPNFRRAVAHAIDRQKIIDIVMNGLGYPQHAAMSPSAGLFYNDHVIKYDYDLDKARQILKEEGFEDRNGDGIIEDKDGHEVQFNLYTNSNSPERVQIAAIIRHDLSRLGMKVNFLAQEFNTLVTHLMSDFDWDAVIIGLTGGIEPHFGKNVWHSTGGLHMWFPRQEKPATEWEKQIDQIFDMAVQELDESKRKVLYDEHQMIVSKELPVIYTVLSSNLYAVRNRFGNLRPTNLGGPFHNIEEIYILPEARP